MTYVGGGFGVGIHNVLEAAVWGKAVIFGPNNQRFREAQGLLRCGGGLEIKSADDFDAIMADFIGNPSLAARLGKTAGEYVESLAGATEKILKEITFV